MAVEAEADERPREILIEQIPTKGDLAGAITSRSPAMSGAAEEESGRPVVAARDEEGREAEVRSQEPLANPQPVAEASPAVSASFRPWPSPRATAGVTGRAHTVSAPAPNSV